MLERKTISIGFALIFGLNVPIFCIHRMHGNAEFLSTLQMSFSKKPSCLRYGAPIYVHTATIGFIFQEEKPRWTFYNDEKQTSREQQQQQH